jgi:hypothetical protein
MCTLLLTPGVKPIEVNKYSMYINAFCISIHLLAYYVIVNPTYGPTNSGNSCISVLEIFRIFIFMLCVPV